MKPGQITLSFTSMVRPAAMLSAPERTMVTASPAMPTPPRNQVWPVPSMMRPLRRNRSNIAPSKGAGGYKLPQGRADL